nr:zeatin O-xylosyltransferase-like [Solanum lycopersicum]
MTDEVRELSVLSTGIQIFDQVIFIIQAENDICLEWLNKQPPSSVLYISFGTTSFSDRKIKEHEMGLELSKQKFIWVLRDANRGDIFTGEDRRVELPEGRVHESLWMEFMYSEYYYGSAYSCLAMHSDQEINGFLVMEMLKIGLIVREWEKREELVSASIIENVVRKLMASEEGDVIKKRAEEMEEALQRSTEKGGAS